MDWLDDTLCVHYDGKGERIKSHQMDGLQVAGSIKAVVTIYNEAFKEANKIYRSKIESEVLVEGAMQGGSLKWLMRLIAKEEEAQISLGESDPLHKRVLDAIKETVDLIKQMDLSTTEIHIHETSDGHVVLVDDKPVVIDDLKCALLTNSKIVNALGDLAKPLDGTEIDKVTITSGSLESEPLQISSHERTRFIGRKGQTKIIEEGRFGGYYYIETLSYSPDAKWKLIKKDSPRETVSGMITDTGFLARVSENTERFAKDDVLVVAGVWYKEKTKLTSKPKTTYIITEVKKHIPAGDHQWQLR